MRGQPGFFDVDERLKRLSDLGDHLEAFQSAVDFEMFRVDLVAALGYSDGPQGGRPPFDPVMMFKILVIAAMDNLSDERTEFLINDRMSFMRFLGLSMSDRVPDARTIWLFREKLTKAGAIEPLFARFDAALRTSGYIAMSGQIVDASLVAAPRQRNTLEEKQAIKEGRIPQSWKERPAKTEGSRRALDGEVAEGQAKRGWVDAVGRLGDPDLRISEPCLDRPLLRLHPQMGGERRSRLRRRAPARGPARQEQHRKRRMGGHGLSLRGQRSVHGEERLQEPCPSQKAQGQAYARRGSPRQRRQIESPLARRACLCRAERPDGPVHPNDRDRPRHGENRHRQSGLQLQTTALPAQGRRLRANEAIRGRRLGAQPP
jgi:transposase